MVESPRLTPMWIIAVAAILAFLLLYNAIGLTYAAGLSVISAAGLLGYRYYRARNPPEPPGIRCVRCGEKLRATARQCDACGSASWTWRN